MITPHSQIVIQGIPGSFHYEAATEYFSNSAIEVLCSDSFLELGKILSSDHSVGYGVMAIENSTAGSIIQNYRIIRENKFRIISEDYYSTKSNRSRTRSTWCK